MGKVNKGRRKRMFTPHILQVKELIPTSKLVWYWHQNLKVTGDFTRLLFDRDIKT